VKLKTSIALAAPVNETVAPAEFTGWAPTGHRKAEPDVTHASKNPRRRIAAATGKRGSKTVEQELMQAMQEYKQKSGRMFPTWSEVLEVLQELGYQKGA
jgi:hypothetical protein